VGAVALAALVAWVLGSAEGYFLPSLVSSGLTLIVMAASLALRRPLVAWTSSVARRWPRDWYWHDRVRPAYSEVTALWLMVFALRLGFQSILFYQGDASLLAAANLLTGWPVTIGLLVVSYLYGTWRLKNLRGPSVQEFETGAPEPWLGQKTGF
jgi:hypothetical protein